MWTYRDKGRGIAWLHRIFFLPGGPVYSASYLFWGTFFSLSLLKQLNTAVTLDLQCWEQASTSQTGQLPVLYFNETKTTVVC